MSKKGIGWLSVLSEQLVCEFTENPDSSETYPYQFQLKNCPLFPATRTTEAGGSGEIIIIYICPMLLYNLRDA